MCVCVCVCVCVESVISEGGELRRDLSVLNGVVLIVELFIPVPLTPRDLSLPAQPGECSQPAGKIGIKRYENNTRIKLHPLSVTCRGHACIRCSILAQKLEKKKGKRKKEI